MGSLGSHLEHVATLTAPAVNMLTHHLAHTEVDAGPYQRAEGVNDVETVMKVEFSVCFGVV